LAAKDVDKVCDVLEVKEEKFRTNLETTEKEVFVYGREVNDFRTVDYDAIAMLNVSATQQIKKDSDSAEDALRKENEILKEKLAKQDDRLAALEKERSASETRLAALEAALLAKPEVRTVSTKATPVINR
jgi:septal ring factor EnvC (AmiA/AmiB activator)